MAKKVQAFIKLQCPAGQANPAPPVGPALGQHGVNIMEFCKQFNARTQKDAGLIIPVVITVYQDRSFTFVTKTPPASILLIKAAKIQKGSGVPNKTKVGTVTKAQVVTDRETGQSRGFGFVEMASGADEAIKALNLSSFQGRSITVNEARPREDRPRGGGRGGYGGGGGRRY